MMVSTTTIIGILTTLLTTTFHTNHAFINNKPPFLKSTHNLKQCHSPSSSSLDMTLRPLYDELSSKIIEKLELQDTDFTETFGGDEWECKEGGIKGTAKWMTESNPKFLTGVSFCTKEGISGAGILGEDSMEEFTINIWMGPSYDTPHMLLTFGQQQQPENTYGIMADYITRGSIPIGSDPQYIETYYSNLLTLYDQASSSSSNSKPIPPPLAFESRLLQSPIRIALCDVSSQEQITVIATTFVDTLLSNIENKQPIAARLRGSFNLRDDKLRQYYYRGELKRCVKDLGGDDEELGQVVAAVNTGPTAEAYVGGGS